MTDIAAPARTTERVAVRNLRVGSNLAMSGEKVLSVQPITEWGRNRWASNHRRLTLERPDGTVRVTDWSAGTQVVVYS